MSWQTGMRMKSTNTRIGRERCCMTLPPSLLVCGGCKIIGELRFSSTFASQRRRSRDNSHQEWGDCILIPHMLIRLMMLALVLVLASGLFAQTNPTPANPVQPNSTQANAASGQQDGPSDLDRCQIITTADLSDPKAPTFQDYPPPPEPPSRKPRLHRPS